MFGRSMSDTPSMFQQTSGPHSVFYCSISIPFFTLSRLAFANFGGNLAELKLLPSKPQSIRVLRDLVILCSERMCCTCSEAGL